ncbi:hydrogenase-4 component B [Oscillibacter sp. PC13]|uniref:complex I subunit 5 family protein n=1 Tax=Oscillibacter sp. PC13 TaxID=1855299 RepID=UPI0008E7F303|nr:complex I subunit 5 family protein [Oscillibacter sp. PC13]SFP18827.1 hydrogenase-4 component B [Oscillibacter sp. PC13]
MGSYLMLFLILFPMASSVAVFPLRRRSREYRNRFIQIVPIIELAAAVCLLFWPGASLMLPGVCGLGLQLTAGSLRSLLVLTAAFLWAMTGLNCPPYFAAAEGCNRFYLFWLLTLGALMGVFLAADLFTLFMFFEMMSFTSYVWVAQNETAEALRAGETYLAVAVIGGMTLLAGLLLLNDLLESLEIARLRDLVMALPAEKKGLLYTAGGCCLIGFGAKAGMYPLHIWLPRAHPVAPAPASALLSGILTKSGVFGVLIISRGLFWADAPWNRVVLALGVTTMVLGAVLAVFSIDLKRTLACSSMSQIGFILVGVAMQGYLNGENALAAWGTVLHMLNHSLIKLVLFVAAGVVYVGAHSLNLNDIRGWGRNKPWLKGVFFVGAASIAGVPGFSGYVSKTLLHESIVEYIHILERADAASGVFQAVEWLFLISGGLTAAYMTKLFVAIFVAPKAAGQRPAVREYMSQGTVIALSCGTLALLLLGMTPGITMEPIAQWAAEFLYADHGHAVSYFAWVNLKGACVSLAIGAMVYLVVVRRLLMRKEAGTVVYVDCWPKWLDLEERLYRPMLRGLVFAGAFCARVVASIGDLLVFVGERILFTRAPGIFVPKHDENFGTYGKKPRRFLVGETFSFDLLLAGCGMVAFLLYLLL